METKQTFTEILSERRDAVAVAKIVLDAAENTLEILEAALYLNAGDLGKNEAERKARFTLLKNDDQQTNQARRDYEEAAAEYADAVNALEKAKDARREYEDAIAAMAQGVDAAPYLKLAGGSL